MSKSYSVYYPEMNRTDIDVLYKLFSLLYDLEIVEDFRIGKQQINLEVSSRYD